MSQRKRTRSGNDISSDLENLRMEDLDSSCFQTHRPQPSLSYASMLKTSVDHLQSTMPEDSIFSDDDCSYSQGKHGLNVCFSEKVHNNLDFGWRCSVIIKLMGKPNSSNTFDFILKGLRRKWQTKSGWKLIDLPNDYFVVKFNLEEDMNEVLCGGPWIIAGQTLIVRKWSPEFNPETDVIDKMALWVRVCGLPVKFFKSFAIEKIGKILGDVVRVDPITISQARGKFARVCVEVDLSKPLRPFVEVESVAYNVVYEGISLICFECGCFGHSKEKCPTVIAAPVQPTPCDPQKSSAPSDIPASADMVNDMEANSAIPSVIKEDMGPWMLMNYRNKKKAHKAGNSVKSPAKGSRFTVLQDEADITTDMDETIAGTSKPNQAPAIVKLWTSFQDKQKNMHAPSTSKAASAGSGTSKLSDMHNSIKVSSTGASGTKARLPLNDLSNVQSGTLAKSTVKYQRKSKPPIVPSTKHQSSISKKLSFDNVDKVDSSSVAGIFGHSPPDDHMVDTNVLLQLAQNSSCFVEQVFSENSTLTMDENLSSSIEEEMVHA
ncbi:hypothetical protein ACLB2K_062904 [Fragaria x ananassa]